MPTHNIHFSIENPVLERLITEQLGVFKTITTDPSLPANLTVTQGGYTTNGKNSFEIPKGAIRLGEIMDKINYLLSGRESHIEDESKIIDLGEFILTPADNILLHKPSQQNIRLTDKERLVLKYLYEAQDKRIPRKDLLKSVWGYADDVETHTLETHIYRLRQKIETLSPYELITIQDGVYRLEI